MVTRRALPAGALALLLAVAVAALLATPARASHRQDVAITSPDGTGLAATLVLPDGSPPPGGWPAIVFLHGLGGNRAQALAIADSMGVTGDAYAVLAYDARGHGGSEGLVTIAGRDETEDARAVYEWLRARPDVADARIGAFGVSYGGATIWNSLAAGVPWAAVAPCITYVDLAGALYPQRLARSGVIAYFVTSLDPRRLDPSVLEARDAAFAGDTAAVTAFADQRSSLRDLGGAKTPAFVVQGRRDLAFGFDQGLRAWSSLRGPKRLWIGNVGHVVSSFPGPDTAAMLAEVTRWFDRFLRDDRNGADRDPAVTLAAEGSSRLTSRAGLPPTTAETGSSRQPRTLATPAARERWTFGPTVRRLETFGSPTVKVSVTAAGGWSRLVAVLTSVRGAETKVVSLGGVPVRQGTGTYTIRLTGQATVIPKGSRLVLTVASSSAGAPGTPGLAYLDLPMPSSARLTVRSLSFSLPVLVRPVS